MLKGHYGILILLFLSGNPLFIEYERIVLVLFTLFIFIKQSVSKNVFIELQTLQMLCFILAITIWHNVTFSTVSAITIVGILCRTVVASYLFKRIANFGEKLTNVMLVLVLISFVFEGLRLLLPSLYNVLLESLPRFGFSNSASAVFYTFHDGIRNPGPFWEPGVFGGYLAFTVFYRSRILGRALNDGKGIMLIIGILSTLSTTAFLALLFILIRKFLDRYAGHLFILKVVYLIPALFMSWFLYQNIPVLGEKINEQLEYARAYSSGQAKYTSARFVNILRDLDQIEARPFFGYGFENSNRLIEKNTHFANLTVGTTDLFVRLGLIGGLYYLSFIFRNLIRVNFSKQTALEFVFFILLLSLSEMYFRYTFFWGLVFLKHVPQYNNVSYENKFQRSYF